MIAPVRRLLDLLYPPKCILCRRLLGRDEADLCGPCRLALPVFDEQLHPGPYCSGAVAALRYEGAVRESLQVRRPLPVRRRIRPAAGRRLRAAAPGGD